MQEDNFSWVYDWSLKFPSQQYFISHYGVQILCFRLIWIPDTSINLMWLIIQYSHPYSLALFCSSPLLGPAQFILPFDAVICCFLIVSYMCILFLQLNCELFEGGDYTPYWFAAPTVPSTVGNAES